MCYDISFTVKLEEIGEYFPDLVFDGQMELYPEFSDHIMGHSYGLHPIIYRSQQDKKLHCRLMEWGCIPFYVKDENSFLRQRASMLNARSERILDDQKSYWCKIRNRRCLIPVSGIYEHRAIKGWKKKVPYFVRLLSQRLFFIPGLYSVAELPDPQTGEMVQRWTYTVITRNANEVMAQIHNDGDNRSRMPLFVPLELAKKWIEEELPENEYRQVLNFEMPSEELDYHPVYTIRSPKPRADSKPKYEYWEWEKLPPLGEMNPD